MENENRSIFRQNEKVLCYQDKLLYEVWWNSLNGVWWDVICLASNQKKKSPIVKKSI